MKLRFTHHAEYRIFYERNISTEYIKKAISKPDTLEYVQDNLLKSEKKFKKNKILAVIYTKGKKNEYIIITAYFK